jgi:hypothetical protein
MDRRTFLAVACGGLLATPLAAEAQQGAKIPRLCFLTFDPGTPQSSRFDPFFQGLRDLGYTDGQTITIDYLSVGTGQQDRSEPPGHRRISRQRSTGVDRGRPSRCGCGTVGLSPRTAHLLKPASNWAGTTWWRLRPAKTPSRLRPACRRSA